MTHKHSKQREAIYDYLHGRTDHPTADAVYNGVRQVFPNISLGTVYRNLLLLRDIGKIQAVDVGDGTLHFDADLSEHSHFICKGCGCVQDIWMKPDEEIRRQASLHFSGQITGYTAYFYGLCSDCLISEEKSASKQAAEAKETVTKETTKEAIANVTVTKETTKEAKGTVTKGITVKETTNS